MSEARIEKIILVTLSLTFFVGLWHGFPFTNVVADESFFSGSVLRSMEAHTILPLAQQVPYGTLTFYLSYFVIAIGLGIKLIFAGFSLTKLELSVIQNPFIVYFMARLVSFALAIFSLFGSNYILKRYVSDYRTRLIIVTTLFTNILVNIIFHTSKVWVLSTVLMLLSFYFLARIFEDDDNSGKKKYIWLSIVFSFLSFANFPFMGMTLVCIPIIFYKYRNDQDYLWTIIKASLLGLFIFLLFLASNFSGIKAQVFSIIFDYTLSPGAKIYNASIGLSAYLHLKKILIMFPLLVLFSVYGFFKGQIKNRSLFLLSTLYLVMYIVLLIMVDRWSTVDKAALRYSFPIPFFIAFLISSFDFPWRKILLFPAVLSVVYLVPTLYFLSVPTTSHETVNFIRTNFSSDWHAIFINLVGADTPIPQNKFSYELWKTSDCESKCQATISYDLEKDFKPLVLDSHIDPAKLSEALKGKSVYFILREASSTPSLSLVASFTAPVADLNYYSADNSGSYFDPAYFNLKRFGPNIYIYLSRTK